MIGNGRSWTSQPVVTHLLCMTVTAAGGKKILAILPLKCEIFSANQGFCGYATWSLPHIGRLEDPVKMTHAEMALVERGLGAKRAHAKSQSAVLSWLWCA